MGEPSQRDLARLYGICEDADAVLGGLAAELGSGQLRSLVTDVLGSLSALQWAVVKRLGGLPDDGAGQAERDSAVPWPELWELAFRGL